MKLKMSIWKSKSFRSGVIICSFWSLFGAYTGRKLTFLQEINDMKMISKPIPSFVLLLILSFFSLAAAANAQCLCVESTCMGQGLQGNQPVNAIHYVVERGSKFKIKVDTVVNSGPNTANDWVQFSTLENLYGLTTQEVSSETEKDGKKEKKIDIPINTRVVVIPAGTKAFGQVKSARGRSPFWIMGKAQIFVTIDYIKIETGYCLPIRFSSPEDYRNLLPCDDKVRKARQKIADKSSPKEGRICIAGRRPATAPAGAFLSAITGAWLGITKDDISIPVAGLTLLDKTVGNTGVGDYVNGLNAEISDKWIFEVETDRTVNGIVLPAK